MPSFRSLIICCLFSVLYLCYVSAQPPPVAEFSADNTNGCFPITVNFTNLSTNSTSWWWDLGNSNTSTVQNPSAIYSFPGTYTVTLVAYNASDTDTIIKSGFIRVFDYPTADFTSDVTYGCAPLTVQFTDLSAPSSAPISSWNWDFGDGNISFQQNPNYSYLNPGINSVSLAITDTNGCTSSKFIPNFITISSPPALSYTMDISGSCTTPLTVNFTNTTTQGTYPVASWLWDFGDGFTSTAMNPQHTWNTYGSFTIKLTATDTVGCSVTRTDSDAVSIGSDTADFSFTQVRTCSTLTVSFSGTSTGTIVSWSYNFGDGSPPASGQNVTHPYTTSGQFTVTLTAINTSGCQDTVKKTVNYLKITAGFEPDTTYACSYPFTVNFTNTTVGTSPFQWSWDFSYEDPPGFTNQSSLMNPSYTYTYVDTFDVMLKAVDAFGCRDSITLQQMGDSIWFLNARANFSFIPINGCIPLSVNFTDGSTSGIGAITTWQWDFDDPASGASNTSTLQNPSHTFNTDGAYSVSLTITTDSGCTATVYRAVYAGYPPTGVTLYKSKSVACHGDTVYFWIVSADTVNDCVIDWGDGTFDMVCPPLYHRFQDTGLIIISFTPKYNGCPGQVIIDSILILPPKPILTAVPTFICRAPATVAFTNNSWGADTWFWDFDDGSPTDITLNPNHTFTAPGSYNPKLVVMNSNGCSDSAYAFIRIPQPTASFTAMPLVGCLPLYVSFTQSSFTYVPLWNWITSWLWDFGDGTFSTQKNPPPHFYSVADTYTVKLIVTDNDGCMDTLTRADYIVVNGSVANFNADIQTGCAPLDVNFSDQSTTSSSIVSWSWTYGDGTPNGTAQNPSHTYSSGGNFNVSLKVTDVNGCSTTMFKNSFISTTLPVLQYSHQPRACQEENNVFTNNSTGSGLTFLWNFGDGDTSSLKNPTHVYSDTGTFNIMLVLTDTNICSDTGNSQIEVVPSPVAGFTVDSVYTKCPPLVVKFTDQSTCINDSVNAWKWDFSDGYFAYVQNPVHTFSYPDTFDVSLVVTNTEGCKDTLVIPDMITVKGPVGNFDFTPDSGCFPLTVTFTAVTSQVDLYTWDFGDGVIDTLNGDTTVHTYPIPGLPYPQLSITDSLGCKLPATPPNPSWISIDKVIPGFTAFPSTLYTPFCPPDTVWFTDTTKVLNDSSLIVRWYWDFGDGVTDSVKDPLHIYTDTGTFTVTLTATSLLGCPGTASGNVKVLLDDTLVLKAFISDSISVSCYSLTDGAATAAQLGGTAPFSYLWSPSAGNQDSSTATGLLAGNHSVTVTDYWGCRDSATVTVSSPAILATLVLDSLPAGCYGDSTGFAAVSAAGGTPPYTYLWNPPYAGTNDTALNLPAQTYSVTITDNNGCDTVLNITVTEPPELTASASQQNISCKGGSDGSATATPSGGTAPYSYLWDDPAPPQLTQTAIGLTAGTWNVTITDTMNCLVTVVVIITEPPVLSTSTVQTDVACNGDSTGTAAATVSGGSGNYTYVWDAPPPAQVTQTATGLAAGTWTVTVTDSLNCTTASSVTITEPAVLSVSISPINVSCNGGNDGEAAAAVAGGIPPYSYIWNNPLPAQVTPNVTGLAAGTWRVTVTDSLSCTKTDSIIISEPDTFAVSFTITNVSCYGDSDGIANSTVTGGTAPYTYSWDVPPPSQTGPTATGLNPGTWMLSVTDFMGCSDTFTVTITEPPALTVTITEQNVSCYGGNDGSADATPAGGTIPYSYLWSTGAATQSIVSRQAGTYIVTVTDSLGCDTSASIQITEPPILTASATATDVLCFGANTGTATVTASGGSGTYTYQWNDPPPVQITQTATGLMAGTWSVTVTDSMGCDTFVSAIITEPGALTIVITSTNDSCFGDSNGTATAATTGGFPPYSYLWNDPAPAQATALATGLPDGTWTITVTDSAGCDTSKAVIITQPLPISILITQTDVFCFGDSSGSAVATASGGTAPYTYIWYYPPPAQSGQTATGLPAGNWKVWVTDSLGCKQEDTVTITEPATFLVTITATNALCYSDSNGTATANPSGGISPYSYEWNNPPPVQISKTAVGLPAGPWSVTVTDDNGCTADTQVTITQPNVLMAGIVEVFTKVCQGNSNGVLSSQPAGGTPPYSYLWLPGNETTSSINNLAPDTYILLVKDSNNCVASDTAAVIELSGVLVSIDPGGSDTACYKVSRNLTAIGMGTVPPYSYLWSDGVNTTNQNPLNVIPDTAHTWFVTVTDASGCTSSGNITLYVNYLDVNIQPSGPVCVGLLSDITASATGSISTDNSKYVYQWSTGNSGSAIQVQIFTSIVIAVTVSDGCSKSNSDTMTLIPDSVPTIGIRISDTAGCPPFEVTFSDTVNDIAGSLHSWNFGDGNTGTGVITQHTFTGTGFYYPSLTVTSPAGCSTTFYFFEPVLVYALPSPYFEADRYSSKINDALVNFTNLSSITPVFQDEIIGYIWDFEDGDTSSLFNATHVFRDTGSWDVKLIAITQYGCRDTFIRIIRIEPYFDLRIPNAFTPNPSYSSGGFYVAESYDNDVFYPITKYVDEYLLQIFNRWGELIFESTDHHIGWDGYYRGKLCQEDTYMWKMKIKWTTGDEYKNLGPVLLVR